MLNVNKWQVFHGPNPLSKDPCYVASLIISNTVDEAAIYSACERVRSRWPQFYTDNGVRQLVPAEALGMTIAQWTWGALNEIRGHIPEFGSKLTRSANRNNEILVWVGFHHLDLCKTALQLSLDIVSAALSSEELDPEACYSRLKTLWTMCQRLHPDYQAAILMEGALEKDLPFLPFIEGAKYWQYGWGMHSRIFWESRSNADGCLASQIVQNKQATKSALSAMGMPAPRSQLVSTEEEVHGAIESIGWPCVIKPLDLGGGKGVTAGIKTLEGLIGGYRHARKFTSGAILLEEFLPGEDHRLMVIRGQLAAVIKRVPASVEGDGIDTIKQLIEKKNLLRSLNMSRSNYLRLIKYDEALLQYIGSQGLALGSVPAAGKQVYLRSNANLSTGGSCIDVTDSIHPQIRQMAEQIAVTLGLDNAGLDYLTEDISAPPDKVKGGFIEANITPGLDAAVAAGWAPQRIASIVLGNQCGRIPVRMTIAKNPDIQKIKDSLIDQWLGPGRALVCEAEAWVADVRLEPTNDHPWELVRKILRNRQVSTLHIVCQMGHILRHGLPIDKLDIITCVSIEPPKSWQSVFQKHSSVVEKLTGLPDKVKGAFI